ncbi:hypothetical protein [Cellulosimicrobium sp. RS]|uniref:hypothetical protein n=1 Tax=Cellulosimicrobium sp. RS TaxID=3381347 RepID=UPI0038FC9A5D
MSLLLVAILFDDLNSRDRRAARMELRIRTLADSGRPSDAGKQSSKSATTPVGPQLLATHRDEDSTNRDPFTKRPGTPIGTFEARIPRTDSGQLQLTMRAANYGEQCERGALLTFEFVRDDGSIAIPVVQHPVHPKLGMYAYLDDAGTSETTLSLTFPHDAAHLKVKGVQWKKQADTRVVSFVANDSAPIARPDSEPTLESWLESRDSRSPIVIIYSTAPNMDHPTLGLRPNRLAREYAALGWTVVFFPFGSVDPAASHYSESILQLERAHLMEVMELVTADESLCSRAIFICSSFPDIQAATAIDYAKMSGLRTVYEVRDEMEEFNRVGYSKWYDPILEMRVARESDLIVNVSPRLAEKMTNLRGNADDVYVVPNGVAIRTIEESAHLRTEAAWAERASTPPTVGYIGHLTPSWFDWNLLTAVANDLPEIRFEIIGHGMPDAVALPDNVAFLGPRDHEECAEIARRWRVGIIPFKQSPLTWAVDPNKIYEYLAFGLRTVSVPMGSVSDCPSTAVVRGPQAFSKALARACEAPMRPAELAKIERALADMSWATRARRMAELMGADH